jgi:hypothetical protein
MTPDRLATAFDRIDDFLAVQSPGLTLDAVLRLQEAVGIDDHARALIGERLATLEQRGQRAAVGSLLLGLLIGLFAGADHH